MSQRRDELLDAAVDHVIEHGFEDLSIRTLASGLGVAHNSLTYHFGSRTELVTAIFRRLSERSREAVFEPGDSPEQSLRAFWDAQFEQPKAKFWHTFFEFLGAALREPEQHAEFLTHVTEAWIQPIADRAEAQGLSAEQSRAAATLLVASVRGLVMDRLAGGDPARTDAAFELLVASARAMLGPRVS